MIALALAAIWIEPELRPEARELRLRLRTTDELVALVRTTARELGGELVRRAREPDETPPVAAGPDEDSGEELTAEERERLDRLIEQLDDED